MLGGAYQLCVREDARSAYPVPANISTRAWSCSSEFCYTKEIRSQASLTIGMMIRCLEIRLFPLYLFSSELHLQEPMQASCGDRRNIFGSIICTMVFVVLGVGKHTLVLSLIHI